MGFNTGLVVSLAIDVLAFFLSSVGAGTTEWFVFDGGSIGLLKACSDISDVCVDLPERTNLHAIRALILIGIVFCVLACVCLVLAMVFSSNSQGSKQRYVYVGGQALTSFGGPLVMSGSIFYASEKSDLESKYSLDLEFGYSFVLCVVAGILMIICGFVMCFGSKTETPGAVVHPANQITVHSYSSRHGQPTYPAQPFTAQYPYNTAGSAQGQPTYPAQPFTAQYPYNTAGSAQDQPTYPAQPFTAQDPYNMDNSAQGQQFGQANMSYNQFGSYGQPYGHSPTYGQPGQRFAF